MFFFMLPTPTFFMLLHYVQVKVNFELYLAQFLIMYEILINANLIRVSFYIKSIQKLSNEKNYFCNN